MNIESADTDAWTIAENTNSDSPTVLRFRPNLERFIGDERYPRRLIIAWSYEATNSSGMPTNEQTKKLQEFEDALIASLDPERLAILAFVFTTKGTREWHFYISSVDQVGPKINEALADKPGLPIELEAVDDPDWSELSAVLSQVSPKD